MGRLSVPGVRAQGWWRNAILIVGVMLLLAGAFFGGRASVSAVNDAARAGVRPPEDPVWVVKEESIGRTLSFSGTLLAPEAPGGMANTDGVITSIAVRGAELVDVGDPILEVNLRPIVAGQGSIPAFRDLRAGSRGPDVVQVRRFLCHLKKLAVCKGEVFDDRLKASVISWQKSIGAPVNGEIGAADIMWFPKLPTRITLRPEFAVGSRVSTDDRPVSAASGALRLEIRLTEAQASLAPEGAVVRFGKNAEGVLGRQAEPTDPDSGTGRVAEVLAPDASVGVCSSNSECDQLLGERQSTTVQLSIEVIPPQKGLGVPVRAILTGADGQTYVLREDGSQVAVTVVGSTEGVALVEGLALNDKVRLAG